MNKNAIISAWLLAAGVAFALPDRVVLEATTTGTNAATTVTATSGPLALRGWIDTVTFDIITAGTTGSLALVAVPEFATLADTTLAAVVDCAADTVIRPRFDPTDAGGAALTNDPAYTSFPYGSVGETFRFSVSNATTTNLTFRCIIKFDK